MVERVVEVEGDVETIKAQLRKELEQKLKQVWPRFNATDNLKYKYCPSGCSIYFP